MRIPSGTTDQYIYFVAVDITDLKTRETGLSGFTVYRSRNGAASAAMTTPTVNETDTTNMPGVYELLLDEDMTIAAGNTTEEMVFHITHASMAPVTRVIELFRPTITEGQTLTVASSALPWNSAWDAEVESEVDDALIAKGLDHLVAASVAGADVTDDSIIAKIVSASATADWDDFVNTTDSLQAIRDRGDAAWTTGGGSADPALLQNTTTTVTSQTVHVLAAGSADDDAYIGAIVIFTDTATSTQKAVGICSDYVGSTKTLTLAFDPGIFTIATGDTVDIIAAPLSLPPAKFDAAGGLPISDAGGLDLDTMDSNVSAILTDTAEIGTAGAGLTAIPWNASWDAEVQSEVDDALVAQGLDHLVGAAVVGADITDNSIIAKLVSSQATADWDDFVNTTDSLQAIRDKLTDIETDTTEIGAAGAGLSNIPWNASWDAEVQSEVDDALIAQGLDHLMNAAVVGTDVVDNSVVAKLVSSAATADWDTFVNTTDSLQAIRDKQTDIEADTNELQGDWVNGGRLDVILDAILVDTGNLDTDWADGGRLDVILDAILVDTAEIGAAGAGLTSVAMSAAGNQAVADLIIPKKNTALNNIEFLFVAASDDVTPVTGATGTSVTRSIDGGAFAAATGTLAEVGNGIYQFDASAADMNGAIITFRFVATGGTPGAPNDTFITIMTSG